MSKSKLKNLKIEDGMVSETPVKRTKSNARTVDELLGWRGEGVYFTKDSEEYERYLEGLGITDLQREAASRSLAPINDRKRLITRLINRFDKHWGQFNLPPQPEQKEGKNIDEVKKILSQGR